MSVTYSGTGFAESTPPQHSISMETAAVVELRQYTLGPGRRDALIDVFERYLVAGQEATGIAVGGIFRDRDDPDRFVWMRGFADMESRRRALEDFYGGPVWAEHGDTANATMIDSDDVLLLRATQPSHSPGLSGPHQVTAPSAARPDGDEWVWVTTCVLAPGATGDNDVETWFATAVHAELERQLRVPVAMWRTEPAENTFPALPVRAEAVVTWMASFDDRVAYETARSRLDTSESWQGALAPQLERHTRRVEELRLAPTARSRHAGAGPVPASARPRVLDGLARTTTGFDFLVGDWSVQNRRLRRPLTGGDEWYESHATASSTTLHNGAISVDEMWYPEEGFAGTSFRTYEPAKDLWTIYWVNSTTGHLQPPVSGRWDEAGEILDAVGPDTFDGRSILARYRWHSIRPESAVWEQAFSVDDGASWETNWVMTWTRVA